MPSSSSGSVRVFYPRHSREELIELLRAGIRQLGDTLPLRRAVLFGSWASGRATAFSDVDVLVVYADPPRSDAYAKVTAALPVRGLEAHVYAQAEANGVATVIERMVRDGVDLI